MRSGQAAQSLNKITINEAPIGAADSGVGGVSASCDSLSVAQ